MVEPARKPTKKITEKPVPLRRRVLVCVFVVIVVLVLLFAGLVRIIVTSSFERLQQTVVVDHITQLQALYQQRAETILKTTRLLAARDDIRQALYEQNAATRHIPITSDDVHTLGVSAVLIYDRVGNNVHSVMHDNSAYQSGALFDYLQKYLHPAHELLAAHASAEARHAIIRFEQKPLFLSAYAVVAEAPDQPAVKAQLGTVVVAQWLDDAWRDGLRLSPDQIIEFLWSDQFHVYDELSAKLRNNEPYAWEINAAHQARAYVRIPAQFNEQDMFLSMTQQQDIAAPVRHMYYLLLVACACLGIILIAVLMVSLDTQFMQRVIRLRQRLSEISQTNDTHGLVDEVPADDIGQLGGEINHVLAKQRGWREQISNRNAAMSLLFNNLPIGILSLDVNGKIQPEFSSACQDIFGRMDLEGLVFSELLIPGEEYLVTRRRLLDYFLLVRTGTVSPEELEEINPLKTIEIQHATGSLTIGCRFYRIDEKGKNTTRLFRANPDVTPTVANSILVTLTDISDEQRLMEEVARSQADYEQLKSMAEDVELFHGFITAGRRVNQELSDLVASFGDADDKVRLGDMQRLVGLLVRGGEAFVLTALQKASKQCASDIVSALGMTNIGESEVRRFRYAVADIEAAINQTEKQFRTLLGLGVEAHAARTLGMMRQAAVHGTVEELRQRKRQILNSMESHKREVVRIGLAQVIRSIPKMASRRNVTIHFSIAGEEVPIELHTIEVLNQVLPHLFRFAFDHGLEKTEVRRAVGKLEAFNLSLSCERTQHAIVVRLADDGQGIDPQRMRRMAIEQKLLTEEQASALSDDDARNLIFSLMHEASNGSYSGIRYIGLNLIVARLHDELDASICVEALHRVGTSMVITIPLN
jgi:sensor domain CHASE-containing protein